MKKLILLTLICSYLVSFSQGPSISSNIIKNGSFSNGLTNWTNFLASWIPVNGSFSAANNEANVTGISGATNVSWHVQLNQEFTTAQVDSLKVGKQYRLTFYARGASARPLKVFFGENGGGFTALYQSSMNLSTTMTRYDTTFTLTQKFSAMKLGFEGGESNVDFFIDNLSLEEVPAPVSNIILNSYFSNELTNWTNFLANWIPVTGNFHWTNNEVNVTGISGATNVSWHVQLNQEFTAAQLDSLEIGKQYKLSFYARGASARPLKVFFGENGGGFTALYQNNLSLSTTMTKYDTTFTLTQKFGAMKLGFEGGESNVDFFMDNIILEELNPPAAISAAPTPTRATADVISVYSDAYTNIGADLNPNWGQSTVNSEIQLSGNNTRSFKSFNYQGMQFNAAQNLTAAGMTHVHIDFRTTQTGSLRMFLISPPNETPYNLTIPTTGWSSVDIPLTAFTGVDMTQVLQIKFDNNGGSTFTDSLLIDNIYFYKNPTISPAPTPTRATADVISVYSDAYTNIGADLNPNWGQSTVNSEIQLSGNNTRSFKSFNYQGMQFNAAQNLTAAGMTHVHIDFRTTQTGSLRMFLISPPNETPYNLTIPTTGWSSVDIPLTAFTGVDMTQVLQIKFDNNGGSTFTDSLLIDNIYFYKVPGIPAAPTPTRAAADVISVYSDAYTNIGADLNPNWGQSTVNSEIQLSGNNTRSFKSFNYQGIQFNAAQNLTAAGMTHVHIDFRTTQTGSLRMFLISPPNETPYNLTIPTTGWSSVDIPLTAFTGVDMTQVLQIKFDNNGGSTFTDSLLIDNIYFYKNPTTASGPLIPAPAPTRDAANVKSIYSDAYTNVAINEWGPNWGPESTPITDYPISGNATKVINMTSGKVFAGIDFAPSKFNANTYTHFHIDYWTPAPLNAGQVIVVKLSNHDGSGESNALEYTISTPQTGQWASLDIPLTDFSAITNANRGNIAQIVISAARADLTNPVTIYFDNLYFFNGTIVTPPSSSLTPAPVPTRASANVLSIFSDTYTAASPVNTNPNWGQGTQSTQFPISGNNTILFRNLNYQGLVFVDTNYRMNLTAAGMTHLHIDYRTKQTGTFKIFLISPGPKENSYNLTIPTTGWSSLDIPLTSFTGVDLTKVFQLKFDNGGGAVLADSILIDNIYFWKEGSTPPPPPTPADTVKFPLTFEQSNLSLVFVSVGGATTQVVPNPYLNSTNNSQFVARTNKPSGSDPLSGCSIQFPKSFDLTGLNIIRMQVWSPLAFIKVKIRLIHNTDPNKFIDVEQTLNVPNSWQELEFVLPRLKSGIATDYQKFALYFDSENKGNGADFYFDNVQLLKLSSRISNTSLTGISVYPIPARNFIQIESEAGIGLVKIFNLNGQEIMNIPTTETKYSLDIRNLSPGNYILKTIYKDKETSHKFTKE